MAALIIAVVIVVVVVIVIVAVTVVVAVAEQNCVVATGHDQPRLASVEVEHVSYGRQLVVVLRAANLRRIADYVSSGGVVVRDNPANAASGPHDAGTFVLVDDLSLAPFGNDGPVEAQLLAERVVLFQVDPSRPEDVALQLAHGHERLDVHIRTEVRRAVRVLRAVQVHAERLDQALQVGEFGRLVRQNRDILRVKQHGVEEPNERRNGGAFLLRLAPGLLQEEGGPQVRPELASNFDEDPARLKLDDNSAAVYRQRPRRDTSRLDEVRVQFDSVADSKLLRGWGI
mmetsp:Transcript_14280/g.26197  ORF Transcript_14280/g.26197 Transcript_14280/m.26197 type:complete len:286 (+) Transcript_14280:2599-3456(+)